MEFARNISVSAPETHETVIIHELMNVFYRHKNVDLFVCKVRIYKLCSPSSHKCVIKLGLESVIIGLARYAVSSIFRHVGGWWMQKMIILNRVERFWNVNTVWIHTWLSNDTQSLTKYKGCLIVFQCHPSNLKVTQDKILLVLTRIERFRTAMTPVWIHPWLWNDAQSLM